MIKFLANAALLTASLTMVTAAQARIAANGAQAGKATIVVAATPQKRISANGVKMGNGIQAGKASTSQVAYVELPRR